MQMLLLAGINYHCFNQKLWKKDVIKCMGGRAFQKLGAGMFSTGQIA